MSMASFRWSAGLCLAVLLASCAGPKVVSPESVKLSSAKLAELLAVLHKSVDNEVVAGAVALVAREGQVAFLESAGSLDREAARPMRADAIFRICSMTKPITSVAAMILVDDGMLKLDDPISKYIPEFKSTGVFSSAGQAPAPAEREVTVFQLLTHTSGLTYGMMSPIAAIGELYEKAGVSDGLIETEGTIADNARKLAAQPLLFQPGSAWSYGLSTDVLGRVVEVASGQTLDEFFHRRIFEPLKMKDTHFRLPASKRDRLAAVYRPRADDKLERQPDEPVINGRMIYSSTYPYNGPEGYFSGGAGLVSTVADYYRFCLCLRNGGELDGARVLKRETVAQMTHDQIAPLAPLFKNHGDGFGLGFGVVTEAGKNDGNGSPGTFSWGGFYFTYFWVDPAKDVIGIIMAQLHPWGNRTLWSDFRQGVYAACLE